VRLDEAAVGKTMIVTGVSPDATGRRLMSIGFVPGTTVEVRRRAPMGDPTLYSVRGAEFAMRRSTAALVEVDQA
jgi:ferrous iron transport protein A